MKSFEYAAPESLSEALSLLGKEWGHTEIMAGGTDLVTALKQHLLSPKRIVSLKNISDLQGIESDQKQVRIGAMTTLGEIEADDTVRKEFPALVTAIENISSPQLWSTGTIGGDLCQRPRCWYYRNGFGLLAQKDGDSLVRKGDNRYHAIYETDGPALFVNASSLAPVLIALNATVGIAGNKGKQRTVKAEELFRVPAESSEREVTLQPNEVLTEIHIPRAGLNNAIYEVRHRQGMDWPYVAAATAFRLEGGKARDARVVLGHVAPKPWVSREAAEALNGSSIDEQKAADAGKAAAKTAKPLSGNAYKVDLVETAVKRAVLAAAKA